ncbi:hypothetical protein ACFL20_12560 [Spirochaetota bacterium]
MAIFFAIGILIGATLNLFFFEPCAGIEIYPQFYSKISDIENIKKSPASGIDKSVKFKVKKDNRVYIIRGDGTISVNKDVKTRLTAFSGDGSHFIKYLKTGNEIEYYNISGDRYWKMKSKEYPYLSYNGRLILLLNADHSMVRIIDNNGVEIGEKIVSGRMCSSISFSRGSDFGGFGFLDGSFYFVNVKGNILYKGKVKELNMVKGLSISRSGGYAAVHYGNTETDYIRVINTADRDYEDIKLFDVHRAKTSLKINNDGYAAIIDKNRVIVIDDSGDVEYVIKIFPKRYGTSSIGFNEIGNNDGIYSVSYTKSKGDARLIVFKKSGLIILSKDFTNETYLKTSVAGNLIFLRGSDSLYCYSFHR